MEPDRRRGEVNWLFDVTMNDISVIYMTAHRCAGGLKKEVGPTIGLPAASRNTKFLRGPSVFHTTLRNKQVEFNPLLSKIEVPRDVRNSKVRRQDKFRRDWSQHKNTCKSQSGTGPGVRRSKRPLLACRTRCICSMETLHN